jgi:hypothetical protein
VFPGIGKADSQNEAEFQYRRIVDSIRSEGDYTHNPVNV